MTCLDAEDEDKVQGNVKADQSSVADCVAAGSKAVSLVSASPAIHANELLLVHIWAALCDKRFVPKDG